MDRVEGIENLTNFDWCGAIRDKLMNSVKKNSDSPMKTTGCAIALLVKFYYLLISKFDFHS